VGTASGIVKEAAAPTRESRRRRDGMDGATADVPQTIRVIWSGDGFWHVTKRTGRSWSGPAAWDRGRGRRRGRSGARWPGTAANGRDCVGVPIYLARHVVLRKMARSEPHSFRQSRPAAPSQNRADPAERKPFRPAFRHRGHRRAATVVAPTDSRAPAVAGRGIPAGPTGRPARLGCFLPGTPLAWSARRHFGAGAGRLPLARQRCCDTRAVAWSVRAASRRIRIGPTRANRADRDASRRASFVGTLRPEPRSGTFLGPHVSERSPVG